MVRDTGIPLRRIFSPRKREPRFSVRRYISLLHYLFSFPVGLIGLPADFGGGTLPGRKKEGEHKRDRGKTKTERQQFSFVLHTKVGTFMIVFLPLWHPAKRERKKTLYLRGRFCINLSSISFFSFFLSLQHPTIFSGEATIDKRNGKKSGHKAEKTESQSKSREPQFPPLANFLFKAKNTTDISPALLISGFIRLQMRFSEV